LQDFGLIDCNASKTPLPAGLKLQRDTQTPPVDKTLYQRMIGKLIFLTHTRYDISYAVNLVSRYMTHPQEAHLKVVKCILQYIKGTLDFGLFYPQSANLTFCGYSDADWGGIWTNAAPPGPLSSPSMVLPLRGHPKNRPALLCPHVNPSTELL
jgi:hypothetical protein